MADEETSTTEESTTETEKTLPQSQVNDLVSREKAKAAEAARKELLKTIGVDDPDTVKSMVEGYRKWEESNKSAEERAAALAAERDGLVAYKASADATIQSFLEAAIAEVPEDKHSLIPDYDEPQRILKFISDNRELLMGKPAPVSVGSGASPTTSGGSASGVSFEEWQKMNPSKRMTFSKEHPDETTNFRARLRGV